MEEFKDIKGYEGKYQISNFGRVKRLGNNKTKKEKILKGIKNYKGYLCIKLYKNKIKNNFLIHRLVAETFIPNPNNYPCVNHKDEDKANNCIDNLEWCTMKYNINYGTCIQRRVKNTDWKEVSRKLKEKFTNRKDQSKPVLQYTKDGEFVREWESTMECARNGFCQGHVASCCRGESKSHKGFIWKYKND